MRSRRGAGAVERDGLENRWACKRPVGSNPTPAAGRGAEERSARAAPHPHHRELALGTGLGDQRSLPPPLHSREGFTLTVVSSKVMETGTAAQGEGMTAAQLGGALEASEDDVVRRWRFDQLVRAGYEDDDAIELAFYLDIDLHLLMSLKRRGCPSETALRIVL